MHIEAVVGIEIEECFREGLEGVFTALNFIRRDDVAQCCFATPHECLCHALTPEVVGSALQTKGVSK